MSELFGGSGASQAAVDANTLAIAALADNIGIPFGAKHDTLGRLALANGKSNDGDAATAAKTRQPISLDGTIKKVAYQTKQGDSTTELEISVNGSVVDTFTLSNINASFGVILEDEVQIGSHCSLYSVSTIDNKQGEVLLKKNCKVGSHSTIMPGVTIGENSIVGAHSFVTSDIPRDCIAVGVPAEIIKQIMSSNGK